MKPAFWDQRFNEQEPVYGEAPNVFWADQLAKQAPGRALLAAEGQGRNALHAARMGWTVEAFDYSPVGRAQALDLAKQQGLSLTYRLESYPDFTAEPNTYDAVGLIFAHMHPDLRPVVHGKLAQSVRPGGVLILQGFHKRQLPLNTGGPKQEAMLFSLEEMASDFGTWLKAEVLEAVQVTLNEGAYHKGVAEVVQYVGRRKG